MVLPKQIGPYWIKAVLGRDGMATVYRAYDPPLRREVALKVLNDDIADDPDFIERFRREAVSIGSLHHPNILNVFAFSDSGPTLYIVMPLLTGGTLKDRLGKPFDPATALPIITNVAKALDYTHKRGIIHRDVKPANILFDDEGWVFLSDYGVAKASHYRGDPLTQSGEVFGTTTYMSPEQVLQGAEPDGRSDQYALGVTLYEMLAGRPPFVGNPVNVMYAHAHHPVPDPRQFNPRLSNAVAHVLQRVLAKNPAYRYPTASEFAAAFEHALTRTAPPSIEVAAPVTLKHTLSEHTSIVQVVAWSPDGKTLASGAEDGSVRLWWTGTMSSFRLNGHSASVDALAWSPDGKILASASRDHTIRLWRDGAHSVLLKGHSGRVNSLAWSPDGEMLVSGSGDGTLRRWHVDGTLLRSRNRHKDAVYVVAWSPDGKTIASASRDWTVQLWGPDGIPRTALDHSDSVISVAWSPNGQTLASASLNGIISLWRYDGVQLATLPAHTGPVYSLAWSPDGQILASASRDHSVRLWQADGALLTILSDHSDMVHSVVWSPSGDLLASASQDSTVRLWRADGLPFATLTDHRDAVISVAWSPDGKTLATGSADKTVRLWQVHS